MADAAEWRVTQCFGGPLIESAESDHVTTAEFDNTGDYLAVGDKAGRIWIYESADIDDERKQDPHRPVEYKFYGQFQSHEQEFDYLKSLDIEEKINMIQWCSRQNQALLLLSTNDKTIKLWKIYERKIKHLSDPAEADNFPSNMTMEDVKIPAMEYRDCVTAATPRRVYSDAHAYHINSISINSDEETFISADDLRINLWNFQYRLQSFNIVDIKPANMEELTEVITSASFHPQHCNILMYSTSRGCMKLVDMRASALCDSHTKIFEYEDESADKSFFSEIISSISDAKFTPDGNYMIARDFLTVKLWDVRSEKEPVSITPIHNFLNDKLCDLYENDCIFDKFECDSSLDGSKFISGTYDQSFVLWDQKKDKTNLVRALKPSEEAAQAAAHSNKSGEQGEPATPNPDNIDYNRKALHVAWHPTLDAVAVACLNNLYMYQSQKF